MLDQGGLWRMKRSPPGWDSWLGGVQGLELKHHLAQLCPECRRVVQVPKKVPFPAQAVVGVSVPKKSIPGLCGPEGVPGWVGDLGASPSHGSGPSCTFPNPDMCWASAPAPNLPSDGAEADDGRAGISRPRSRLPLLGPLQGHGFPLGMAGSHPAHAKRVRG